ncbi:6-phospho-beta-glucosidase [Clostridium botulinum]|uniref:6-phospho-beta-glucosidase n=1 Tax=Clostridium botulinum (strain Eklund 17B / Type B) TaxID=935198 RepID=B2TLJ7_CLOBB|nr:MULTISPECIES: 6-phospho-beta-glucosidase [unclassified Clostridium]ACD22229.1 6-phospho-beta-glucosidase [Clostridium botulinum B str. Eklund 17B (NRP)]MBN1052424.1 6-phospho-beta-glucosidase [Clostridium botulinum]MBY6976960.1 6-phospho-beta-glucosidase [Clostridium botulinum]MBY6999116.1 6-phospho-beta-glucosidase [Clostridium botulinum]MCR1272802.1 6-phospho-beta-glucosidase [Clostridium botulinum]
MKKLKIAIIGGGSSYTPEIIEGFIKREGELPVKEIYLVDIKDGEEKLNIVGNLAKRMIKKVGLDIKIILTLDRREALKDADFVTTQFRIGGLDARVRDERFPLKYDVLGQETVGPGGLAKALRTIPVILDICKDMKELCPNAYLINFTNPSGMVTEAVNKYTNIKCIGLCNVPIHMKMDIAKMLDVDTKDLFIEFVGLNHLVWGRKVWYKGEDITKKVIEGLKDGASLTMKNISDLKWPVEFLDALKMIPCPYHRYYYMTDRLLDEEKKSAQDGQLGTRAEQVKRVEKKLFELYKSENLDVKPTQLEKRGGAYYSDAAVSLISAIYNDKKEIHTVNIKNNGIIKGIPNDAIIETNCLIDKRGATPLALTGDLEIKILGLIQSVKAYETLAVESAITGDKNTAIMALTNNPLISSIDKSIKLVNELIEINKCYLPQFK